MTNKPINEVIAEIKQTKGNQKYCSGLHQSLESDGYVKNIYNWARVTTPARIDALIDHIAALEQQLAAERERLEAYDRAAKEPVLYCMACEGNLDTESISESKSVVDSWVDEWNSSPRSSGQPTHKTIPLFTAPPLPVVPDEVPESLKVKLIDICDLVENNDEYCQDIWKACLAAMLQSGQFRDATKMVQLSGNSEQVNHSVDATDMVNSSVIPKGCKLALSEAVAAIYFNDSSGYLSALFSVVKALSPEIMELFLNNEKAAFDATRLASAPQHGNSQSSISSSNSTGCGVNACNQSSKGDA